MWHGHAGRQERSRFRQALLSAHSMLDVVRRCCRTRLGLPDPFEVSGAATAAKAAIYPSAHDQNRWPISARRLPVCARRTSDMWVAFAIGTTIRVRVVSAIAVAECMVFINGGINPARPGAVRWARCSARANGRPTAQATKRRSNPAQHEDPRNLMAGRGPYRPASPSVPRGGLAAECAPSRAARPVPAWGACRASC